MFHLLLYLAPFLLLLFLLLLLLLLLPSSLPAGVHCRQEG
jgi:hypothetical protein